MTSYDKALERARKLKSDYQKELDKVDKNIQLAGQLRDGISALEMVFPELRESEDERIRQLLVFLVRWAQTYPESGVTSDTEHKMLAYLEKQKYDRMKPIYDARESFESALEKAWKDYNDSGARTVDGCEDDYVECAHAKGFREGYLFGLEKQKESLHIPETCKENADSFTDEDERTRKEIKDIVLSYRSNCISEGNHYFDECLAYLEKLKDASKAIEAVERIDKYIDEHLANAHDMKDSDPDKKYYRGLDDALGKISGILQDVYSSEKQKEQKPIKMEVYKIGKGTTVCGQDYKCKKDYRTSTCWYIKDAIYHCSRDGYLNDQNGVSWSCTPEWFNEYIQSNTEWAEEEKTHFVSGQFLQCKLSFDEFKEGEHYWLEYVGDDMYVGRSDNVLNQKFHITPRQLFTLFSQELEEVQGPPQEEKQVSLNYEPSFNENPSDNEIIEALIHHLNEQDGFLTAINCVSTKAILSWLIKQKEQKPIDIDFVSDWLRKHIKTYINSEYNEFHKAVEYDGSIDIEHLIEDLKKATDVADCLKKQKEQDKCPEYCVRSHCIGCSIYEKQKKHKPILEVFGFKVGDAVRLKDGDGRKHIIKSFEEVEGIHGPNFYHVEFEDNSARDGIYPGEEYPNGYYTQMEKFEEEQKPTDYNEYKMLIDGAREDGKINGRKEVIDHPEEYGLTKQKSVEWSDEDKEALDMCLDVIPKKWKTKSGILLTKWLKDNIYLQPKQEWNDEDQKALERAIDCVRSWEVDYCDGDNKISERLKSFSERFNLQSKQEWSEEDKKNFYWISTRIQQANMTLEYSKKVYAILDWLKSLNPSCKPSEWNEEDKNRHDYLCHLLRETWDKIDKGSCIDDAISWLEKLPTRVSLSSWKPTEEQMEALKSARLMYAHGLEREETAVALESLYHDLEKLM